MGYDFDREVDRRGTDTLKWEFIQAGDDLLHWEHTDRFFGPQRTLPLWVALTVFFIVNVDKQPGIGTPVPILSRSFFFVVTVPTLALSYRKFFAKR